MRTIEQTIYRFDELTEPARQNAIGRLSDINVDHDWWDFVFDDAKRIGLKITRFDDYKCDGQLIESVGEVCRRITLDHGKHCATYKTAQDFYARKHDGNPMDEDEFLGYLLEDYRIMLRDEYEYMTSEDAIVETIKANEYEFDEVGQLV